MAPFLLLRKSVAEVATIATVFAICEAGQTGARPRLLTRRAVTPRGRHSVRRGKGQQRGRCRRGKVFPWTSSFLSTSIRMRSVRFAASYRAQWPAACGRNRAFRQVQQRAAAFSCISAGSLSGSAGSLKCRSVANLWFHQQMCGRKHSLAALRGVARPVYTQFSPRGRISRRRCASFAVEDLGSSRRRSTSAILAVPHLQAAANMRGDRPSRVLPRRSVPSLLQFVRYAPKRRRGPA